MEVSECTHFFEIFTAELPEILKIYIKFTYISCYSIFTISEGSKTIY